MMSANRDIERYSRTQVILHWISAVIIVWLLVSSFYVAYVEVDERIQAWVDWLNVPLATLYIPVFILRCVVRVRSPVPASIDPSPLGRKVAHIAHLGLYWLTAMVLFTGVLMMEHEIDLFGLWQLPAPVTDSLWRARWFTVHIASCIALAALVLLHVAAVCLHQWRGHRILRRMGW